MAALITTLTTGQDNFETVRDRIAEILAVESVAQQTLAIAASEDPEPYKLRVFLERSNPWEEWLDAPDTNIQGVETAPIVSVCFDNASTDERASNIVERQKLTAVYNIDCYGYGKAIGNSGGHMPADLRASLECQRAIRLVRRFLMAAHYTYLGFSRGANQIVWRRMVRTITMFQPQIEARPVQKIVGARIAFAVEFSEFSPQVEGQPLELVGITVERDDSGEVFALTSAGLQPDSGTIPAAGTTVVLAYYDALDTGSVADAADYTLTGTDSVVTNVAVAGSAVTLTLDTAALEGETVLLDYTPGATPIKFSGANGNPVSALHQFALTNNSTVTP